MAAYNMNYKRICKAYTKIKLLSLEGIVNLEMLKLAYNYKCIYYHNPWLKATLITMTNDTGETQICTCIIVI